MLDEAHERSTNCDILLGLLKSLVGKRPDIKILITSATLDSSRFVSFFKGTCVIEIPGRSFPVQIYHSKQAQVMGQNGPISAYVNSVVETTLQVHFSEPEGHILVFLTGHREVEDVCLQLLQRERKVKAKNGEEMRMKILPLYSSLPNNVQRKIFKSVPHNVRKVVVATNIAETSITVEGIKYVIDCGFTKQKAYDPTRNIESLMVVPISQVSAQQRAGRAGRTAPGKCFRLYSKDAYEKMLPATVPEIKRTNLANVLLNLKVLGIHDVIGFNYIDHPGNDLIFDGLKQLFLLGAIDESGKCTEIGKSMSKYPLEPKLARALIEAEKLGCASEMLVIVSMLSCGDIFVNTASSDVLSDKENYMFLMKDENLIDSAGDHLSYLRIFWVWSNQTNKYDWCRQRRLNRKSLLLANSIMLQLKQIMGSTSDLQIHNFKNIPSEKIRKAGELRNSFLIDMF
jgi:ATP-dependent RNA helicase DHX8/PRP22